MILKATIQNACTMQAKAEQFSSKFQFASAEGLKDKPILVPRGYNLKCLISQHQE